jgi:hypothetical protein
VLAKQIQWEWDTEYGKGKYVVMFGGLHIPKFKKKNFFARCTMQEMYQSLYIWIQQHFHYDNFQMQTLVNQIKHKR